jgi:hypothetical protein
MSKVRLNVLAWLTWIMVAILLAIVAYAAVGSYFTAIGAIGGFADYLPDLGPTIRQLGGIALAFGICVAVVLVSTGVLVGYVQTDRIFRPSALRWVNVLVGAFVVGTALVGLALFFIPGPFPFFALVEGCLALTITIDLVLLVLRTLLRRAVGMHLELDEVV